ncbi:MAG: PorT family protein [Chitinophagaceae bacterium]|nr:PorT family protein [Chitinophagaceae bacterium]
MYFRILALLFVFFTGYSSVLAQVPGLQFGIKGGTNITKIVDKSFQDEFRYGYHLGAFAVLKISKDVQLQPEVLFNQYNTRTSSSFKDDVANPDNLKNVTLNYLSIPVLLNITPSKLFSFQVGPQFGQLINRDNNLVANGKNAFREGDFSMLGGLQINIGNIKINGRYIIGLSDISELPEQNNWKNQGFQLSLGYRIL